MHCMLWALRNEAGPSDVHCTYKWHCPSLSQIPCQIQFKRLSDVSWHLVTQLDNSPLQEQHCPKQMISMFLALHLKFSNDIYFITSVICGRVKQNAKKNHSASFFLCKSSKSVILVKFVSRRMSLYVSECITQYLPVTGESIKFKIGRLL